MSTSNILLLMTDQHRLDTLGCYGNQLCETPALDALATDGTRFTNGFTPTAICTPARATLQTGVLPYRHTLLANYERNVGYREELDDTFPPFSHYLGEVGYQLGHIGKWHVGKIKGPKDFGYDGEHYAGWGNAVQHPDYQRYLAERGYPPFAVHSPVRGTFANGEPGNLLAGILDQPVEATFEYFLAERTIEHLRRYAEIYRNEGRPFFLACNWFGPHLPYLLPEGYYHRYDADQVELPASIAETFAKKPRVQQHYSSHWTFDSISPDTWRELIAAYWGYVTLIDEQVGRILSVLDELRLASDTAVLFTADHGEFTGAHRLHDKGPAMYDDIYRVPLLARVPGLPAGRVEDGFATLTDLTPTFLDLAGVDLPEHYQGRSLLPLIAGEEPADWPTEVVAEFHGHHFPYPQRMIRTERYKLIVNPADENELYDLQADPHELQNRYDHPELAVVRRELMGRLYELLRERGDNFYHWMTSMFEVGAKTYDTALSALDEEASRP
ncbi:sulfatase-like hydrolase/transferase [Actinopolymorpha alba]|uniref:sulfatase-like hydrolase/transferase n=1 Tax=Actinopolymorpha alba TaxID=533267 RepID=UPI00035DD18C|nr:sulfatase-like hydrolase/transferase [Actinopolymorpha alba]